jgi:beta-galactosidase
VQNAFEPLFRANIDTAIINVGHEDLSSYKLVVVPADYVMDEASAKNLRNYVSNGGTVLMTAYSAKEDEHALWFDTPLPGRLGDVFGLKTNAFYDGGALNFELNGKPIETTAHRYEVLEPSTATVLARFTDVPDHLPALALNKFGKGNAAYLATESIPSAIGPVLEYLCNQAGVQRGPRTPEGVYARVIDGRTLYVNTTGEQKTIPIEGGKKGIISGRVYDKAVTLRGMDADLVQ